MKSGEDCGSEGSYQSFQQGDEESESQLEPSEADVSDPIYPRVPLAGQQQHRLDVTATAANSPNAAAGPQTAITGGVLEVPANPNMTALGERSEDGGLGEDKEEGGGEDKEVSSVSTPQLHGASQGGREHQGGDNKGYDPVQSRNTVKGKALSARASMLLSPPLPAAPRSVHFEIDQEGRIGVGSEDIEAEHELEAEDQALLLPDSSLTAKHAKGEQDEGDGGGGDGMGKKARGASLQKEPAGEEGLVDDIDDESTALLDAPTTAFAGLSEIPSSSESTPAAPEATATVAAAEAVAAVATLQTSVPSSCAVSALPKNGEATRAEILSSRAEAAGAATAAATPAAVPPVKRLAQETAAASPTTATAATFNYYELPPIPEEAPTRAAERSPGQPVPPDASAGTSQRSSPLSRSRLRAEKVCAAASRSVSTFP